MNEVVKVKNIIESLRAIDDSFIKDSVATQFIEVLNKNNEIQINGNFEGLLHVALKVLEVATKNEEGTHHHFDETELLDKCDLPIVVSYKRADWD